MVLRYAHLFSDHLKTAAERITKNSGTCSSRLCQTVLGSICFIMKQILNHLSKRKTSLHHLRVTLPEAIRDSIDL